jgi:hypothetical protein
LNCPFDILSGIGRGSFNGLAGAKLSGKTCGGCQAGYSTYLGESKRFDRVLCNININADSERENGWKYHVLLDFDSLLMEGEIEG